MKLSYVNIFPLIPKEKTQCELELQSKVSGHICHFNVNLIGCINFLLKIKSLSGKIKNSFCMNKRPHNPFCPILGPLVPSSIFLSLAHCISRYQTAYSPLIRQKFNSTSEFTLISLEPDRFRIYILPFTHYQFNFSEP